MRNQYKNPTGVKLTQFLTICNNLPSSLSYLLHTILTVFHAKCIASFIIKAGISLCDTAAFTQNCLSSHTINAVISAAEQLENLLLPFETRDLDIRNAPLV